MCTGSWIRKLLGISAAALTASSAASGANFPAVRTQLIIIGLGWRLNLADGIAWEADDGPGASASLVVRLSDNHACVALTNRKVPILGLYRKVFRPGS